MCTAISFLCGDHYFGRTLDQDRSFGEGVVVVPRKYALKYRKTESMNEHFAIIGMGIVQDEFPLLFEGTNEQGLSMAGLNFPGNAYYFEPDSEKVNVAPFELIPWILGQCNNVEEAQRLLQGINICDIAFSADMPLTPLHWMISDKNKSIVLETTALEGLKIYTNPVGILTNNPPFPIQLFQLNQSMGVSAQKPVDRFAPGIALEEYSKGMGALGLPGDNSSISRFVRAAFVKMNSNCPKSEDGAVSQFFHILGSVTQQRGTVITEEGEPYLTQYSSCCNTDTGRYYFVTYENARICYVDLRDYVGGERVIWFSLPKTQDFYKMQANTELF